ncbi:unnamed protein product [Gemmata massiliana]|uniref:Uncharacterized protein n=1 Tax=Gemmata massiliana TaxID=1210884 RepID=A0A6P2D122_9BACT|nr:hypothetical protein [Gemmata massiliana]VTR94537.1 unnamed protein product [Gemmata massiliana]
MECVWERSSDDWLKGSLGLAPPALLTDEASADLETALDRFHTCLIGTGADRTVTNSVLRSSYVLCGLRYDNERMAEMYRRLSMLMKESTTHQAILGEGCEQGLEHGRLRTSRELLLQGTKKFGSPSVANAAILNGITDLGRLERLADQVLDATGWDEWLKTE